MSLRKTLLSFASATTLFAVSLLAPSTTYAAGDVPPPVFGSFYFGMGRDFADVFRKECNLTQRFLELIKKKNIEEVELGDCIEYEISILFNDIRSFTTHLEKRTPKDAFAFVNRYWDFMAPVIRRNNGYIDQFQGDAVLAIFPKSPDDAINAGLAMLKALKDFNKKQRALNELEVDIGIGINTGSAMLGIVGEVERLDSAVISDVTNTAARVETLNKTYGTHFLISENSYKVLKSPTNYSLRRIDKVILKGRTEPTYLYEVIDWEDQLQGISLDDYIKQFYKAFERYEQGDFQAAKQLFEHVKQYYESDPIANLLLSRISQFMAEGAPPGWDGTFKLTHK